MRAFKHEWKVLPSTRVADGLHANVYAALHVVPFAPLLPRTKLHIYTDGSAGTEDNEPIAGWSVLIVQEDKHIFFTVIGRFSGAVSTDCNRACAGVDDLQSATAEACALWNALRWCMQLQGRHDITIHVDASLVAEFVTCVSSWHNAPRVAHLAKGLWRVLWQNGKIQYIHVPGHKGFPWNEWCDGLAKFASRKKVSAGLASEIGTDDSAATPHNVPLSYVNCPHSSRWLWLVCLPKGRRAELGLPPMRNGTLWLQEPKWNLDVRSFVPDFDIGRGDPSLDEDIIVRLRVGSLNVRSLKDNAKVSEAEAGRVPALRKQFEDMRLHVIAIQEAKSRAAGSIGSATHFRLCSGPHLAPKGDIELWFSVTQPIAWTLEGPIRFDRDNVQIVNAQQRMMIASVRTRCINFDIVAVHAPCSVESDQQSLETAQDFWKRLQELLDSRPAPRLPLLIVGDYNCRFGDITSAAIGGHGPGTETLVSNAVHTLLLREQLCLPSTFAAKHSGSQFTWRNTRAAASRIDFCAVPQEWLAGVFMSQVVSTIDVLQGTPDHSLVCVWQLQFPAVQKNERKRDANQSCTATISTTRTSKTRYPKQSSPCKCLHGEWTRTGICTTSTAPLSLLCKKQKNSPRENPGGVLRRNVH